MGGRELDVTNFTNSGENPTPESLFLNPPKVPTASLATGLAD